MSLDQFKAYVESRGVDFNTLTNEEKRSWSETFDKSLPLVKGDLNLPSHNLTKQVNKFI